MEAQAPEQPPHDGQNPASPGGRILTIRPFWDKTRRRWLIGLVAALAAATWYASLRQSTGPAAGGPLAGPAAPAAAERETFRVGTWNIHGGVGRDGHRDLERTAKRLDGLDLVALNEVHGWGYAAAANQAALLGLRLHRTWLNGPAEQQWYCWQFGNGLLSTRPIDHWKRVPLPDRFAQGHRNMLLVATRHRGQSVQLLITHLVHSDVALRKRQFEKVQATFLALKEPAILLGDLNMGGNDPQIQALLARPGVVNALAFRVSDATKPGFHDHGNPSVAAPVSMAPSATKWGPDWLLVRGLRVVRAGRDSDDSSDHPLVWADLAMPADRGPAPAVQPRLGP